MGRGRLAGRKEKSLDGGPQIAGREEFLGEPEITAGGSLRTWRCAARGIVGRRWLVGRRGVGLLRQPSLCARLFPHPDPLAWARIGHLEHAAAAAHAAPAHTAATHATATHATHHPAAHTTPHATTHAAAASHPHGDDEVSYRIDLDDHVLSSLLLGGDQHHLVLDEIREIDLAEEEPQRRTERHAGDVLRHGGVEIEPRVIEGFLVELDGDPLGILDLGDHVTERSLIELKIFDRLIEGLVDPLFGAPGIAEIDRLVLLAESRDLLPACGAGIDDRRLVRERDRSDVGQMEDIHEPTLGVAADPDVLGVVVEDPGDERCGDGELPGCHRDATVGVQRRCLLGDLLGDDPFRLGELVGGLLVPDADPLFDEGVIALRELLDAVFATPQFAVESGAFLGDGVVAVGHEGPLGPLARADDRVADRDLDLPAEPIASRRVEVLSGEHLALEILQIDTRPVWIDRAGLAGRSESHGHFLLDLLGTHLSHPCKISELTLLLAGSEIAFGRRSAIGEGRFHRREARAPEADDGVTWGREGIPFGSVAAVTTGLLGLLLLEEPLLGRGEHHPSIDVIGILAERGIGQPHRRTMSPGSLCLPGHLHKGRGLSPNHVPGDVEPLPAERRQVDAVGLASIAVELLDVGILGNRCRGGDRNLGLVLPHGSIARGGHFEHEVEAGALEATLHEEDGIAVGTQRREIARKHAKPGIGGLGGEHDILGPGDRLDGRGGDPRTGIGGGDGGVGNDQHSPGRVGDRRQARPIDRRPDADGRDTDALVLQDRQQIAEFGRVDSRDPRSVTDVDDGARRRRSLEPLGSPLEYGHHVGRSEGRADFKRGERGPAARRPRAGELLGEGHAGDVGGGHEEPVVVTGLVEEGGDHPRGVGAVLPRLICRRVDEDDHIGRCRGVGQRRGAQADRRDRQRRFVTLEGLDERHRDAVIGSRSQRHQRQSADEQGDGRRENGLRHGPSRRAGCVMQPRPLVEAYLLPPVTANADLPGIRPLFEDCSQRSGRGVIGSDRCARRFPPSPAAPDGGIAVPVGVEIAGGDDVGAAGTGRHTRLRAWMCRRRALSRGMP